MAEKENKKKKEKTSVTLPKAWQSVKHRNETSQTRTDLNDAISAIGMIILILVIAFVLLGGVSQTGVLKFIFNWSQNVGHTISSWIEDTSIVTNENGVYIDPTGKNGTKIGDDENNVEIVNPMEEITNSNEDTDSNKDIDSNKEDNSNKKKTDEVKTK